MLYIIKIVILYFKKLKIKEMSKKLKLKINNGDNIFKPLRWFSYDKLVLSCTAMIDMLS